MKAGSRAMVFPSAATVVGTLVSPIRGLGTPLRARPASRRKWIIGTYEMPSIGSHDRLGAVMNPELVQYPADVRLYRGLRDLQVTRNFTVCGQTVGEEHQHLSFPWSELK